MTEIMFESYNVPAMYIASKGVLPLYSAGITTGIICESGDGITQTVPIYEGFPIPDGVA